MSVERNSCDTCENVHADTAKLAWELWRCVKFPILAGTNAVAPNGAGSAKPPYMRCSGIQGGYCPVWAPRRAGQHDNGL